MLIAKEPETQFGMSKEDRLDMRQKLNMKRVEMMLERSTFDPHWRDIAEHIRPRRARFLTTDVNKGTKQNYKIVDGTATRASRTLRSGMMSGVTSPSRQWFRLTTQDPGLMEKADVKDWLNTVTNRMNLVYSKSNLYSVLPILYGDGGDFATGAVYVEEDFDDVIRFKSLPIGSYYITNNEKGKTDSILRDFRFTIRQIVEKFGRNRETNEIDWTVISPFVKNYYDNGRLEAWVDITHVVYPNPDWNPKRHEAQYKRYRSVYFERAGGDDTGTIKFTTEMFPTDRFLRISGYDYFPCLIFRWETTGEDAYGTSSPGMDSLGDIKELMRTRKTTSKAIEKQVDPPMVAPVTMKNMRTSILAGEITYLDNMQGNIGFKPAMEVKFETSGALMSIQDLRKAVKESYFVDLFMMISEINTRERVTKAEIDAKKDEKMLALGPVMENLNQEVLAPLIHLTFNFMARQGWIPPMPPSMQGMEIEVEYLSIVAQAMKLLGLAGIERFTSWLGTVAPLAQGVMDAFDEVAAANIYGDMVSLPPHIVRDPEKVQATREQKAKAQAQQEKMAQMEQASKTAKNLAQAPTDGNNALTQLMQQANAGNMVPQQ